MTIAAGFVCRDGIIVCADTEFTYNETLKFSGSKIDILVAGDTVITMTGAGHSNYSKMAWQKIIRRMGTHKKKGLSADDFADIVEAVVGEIYKKHIPLSTAEPKPWFSLIFAIKANDGGVGLITTDDTAVSANHTFEIAGVGATFGRFLADLLQWSPANISLREGAIWAAYILWIAKKYTPGCGGVSSIITISRSGELFFLDQIAALEERFGKWDSLLRPLFVRAVDTRMSDEDFGAHLQSFSEEIKKLRTEWQAIPVLEPELVKITKI